MARPFLTARWLDVCILSYPVRDEHLAPHLPDGLELDRWGGRAFVSLVAFQFRDCRVGGIAWPGHRHFPELNLRFYVVKHQPDGSVRRGVVFIREYVPRRLISMVARLAYNEPYSTAPMRGLVSEHDGRRCARYDVDQGSDRHHIELVGDVSSAIPAENSVEHFFKEHQWGYGVDRTGRLHEYEVRHPRWATHAVRSVSVDLDWSWLYGKEWGSMNDREPESVVFAAGSEVEVHRKHRDTATDPE